MAQSDVFHLEGGSRFEGRRHGDSQQMKCAEHRGLDGGYPNSMFSCSSEFSIGTVPFTAMSCRNSRGCGVSRFLSLSPFRRTSSPLQAVTSDVRRAFVLDCCSLISCTFHGENVLIRCALPEKAHASAVLRGRTPEARFGSPVSSGGEATHLAGRNPVGFVFRPERRIDRPTPSRQP